MTFRVLRRAEEEGYAAVRHYRRIRASLATDYRQRLDDALAAIVEMSGSMPLREPQVRRREIRWCKVKRFPYIIYFEVFSDDIVVLAIRHERQHPSSWLRRKV